MRQMRGKMAVYMLIGIVVVFALVGILDAVMR